MGPLQPGRKPCPNTGSPTARARSTPREFARSSTWGETARSINFSIGQPDFDVPEPVRRAAIDAIQSRKNGYALSQGMPVLREKLLARVQQEYGHPDRDLFVTSGTSGGLMLALMVLLNPGDEVIVFDPFFVMYDALAKVLGAGWSTSTPTPISASTRSAWRPC